MRTHFEHIDDTFRFGKFRDCTLAEVLTYSPSYLDWMARTVDRSFCSISQTVIEEIKLLFPGLPISYDIESLSDEDWSEDDCPEEDFDTIEDFDDFSLYEDKPTYNRYRGSYAQDEAGYSDDDIDTIFDGEPDAYWNID